MEITFPLLEETSRDESRLIVALQTNKIAVYLQQATAFLFEMNQVAFPPLPEEARLQLAINVQLSLVGCLTIWTFNQELFWRMTKEQREEILLRDISEAVRPLGLQVSTGGLTSYPIEKLEETIRNQVLLATRRCQGLGNLHKRMLFTQKGSDEKMRIVGLDPYAQFIAYPNPFKDFFREENKEGTLTLRSQFATFKSWLKLGIDPKLTPEKFLEDFLSILPNLWTLVPVSIR